MKTSLTTLSVLALLSASVHVQAQTGPSYEYRAPKRGLQVLGASAPAPAPAPAPSPAPAPVLTGQLSVASLAFGPVEVGASAASQKAQFTNTGNQPLALSAPVLSSAASFSMTTTCGASLAPSESCDITAVFSPAASGSHSANVTLGTNASNGPFVLALSGSGLVRSGELSASALTFPATAAGSSSLHSVLFTNTGGLPLELSVPTLAGSAAFSSTTTCTSSLAPSESCQLSVTFTPSTTGAHSGTLTLGTNAANGPFVVSLDGTATVPVDSFAANVSFASGFENGFSDQSSNGLNLTAVNGATTSTAVARVGSYSAFFNNPAGDGLAANVKRASTTTGGELLNFGTGPFTLEGWIYHLPQTGSTGRSPTIISNSPAGYSAANTWFLAVNHVSTSGGEANKLTLHVGGNTSFLKSNAVIPTSQWTHFALVRNASGFSLYVNGTLDATVANTTASLNGNGGLVLGLADSGARGGFNGYMDNIRITKGVARYSANFSPSTLPY